MKFKVTLKADAGDLSDAIADAAEARLGSSDRRYEDRMTLRDQTADLCRKWFSCGELTVEIDTDDETCVVVPVK